MKIFPWRGRISRRDFRRRFIEKLGAVAPHLSFEESADDDLDLEVSGVRRGDETVPSVTVSLHRGYREMENDPAKCESILDRWIDSQGLIVDPQPPRRENLLPFVKSSEWLRDYRHQYDPPLEPGAPPDMLHVGINEELVVVFADYRSGIRFLHRSELAGLGLEEEELWAAALENLRAKSAERTIKEVAGSLMIHVGGNFESAQIFDAALWREPALASLPAQIIAVPERNWLLAACGTSPLDIWRLSRFGARLHRDEPYPISPRLMIRRDDRLELLDPEAIDETHPIPNLDVIDVCAVKKSGGATLSVVVATPLDVSPRSIHRLFRKIDGYLDFIATPAHTDKCGTASPANTEIELEFVAHPDVKLVEIYDEMNDYVASRGAALEVTYSE